jgi:hypothetical protein
MFISRRKFLKAGSVIALAAGFPLKSALTSGKQPPTPTTASPEQTATRGETKTSTTARPAGLANYSKATFMAQINSVFLIQAKKEKPVQVKLIEVNDVGPIPDRQNPGRECFSLVFSGQPRLRQDTYTINHAALGKFSLLIVPVGKNKKGAYYEAVINRLNS